jgi:hypothetical protein
VAVEGNAFCGRTGLCGGKGDTEHRVCAQLALVGGKGRIGEGGEREGGACICAQLALVGGGGREEAVSAKGERETKANSGMGGWWAVKVSAGDGRRRAGAAVAGWRRLILAELGMRLSPSLANRANPPVPF